MIRHFEFWHPRLFEVPYYVYLAWRCLVRGLPPKYLAKANWALDHGEIGIGSKFDTQMAFDQTHFPATAWLSDEPEARRRAALAFAAEHGYPLVLKPDQGSVGKGVTRAADEPSLLAQLERVHGPYMLQTFCPHNIEYGVFFVRTGGEARVTGLNRKHFPTIVGDGERSIEALARDHERYTAHWQLFLQDIDTARVPAAGESVQLSFVGSHTMGCKFTDDTHVLTSELERAIIGICDSQPGFNFGRLDVKAPSEAAFLAGEFVVIEVNGVASLPTHMFDPANSLARAYRIFLEHGRLLVDAASENRDRPMTLYGWRDIGRRVAASQRQLNEAHSRALGS